MLYYFIELGNIDNANDSIKSSTKKPYSIQNNCINT